MSTVEGLKGFSYALARCSEHPVLIALVYRHIIVQVLYWSIGI